MTIARCRSERSPSLIIPVTCQLTCPVTDYISKFSENGEIFLPRMFQGFPEIKEALISNKMQAAFIVAPHGDRARGAGRSDQGRLPRPSLRQRRRRSQGRPHQDRSPICAAAPSPSPAASPTSACIVFRAMKVWGMKPSDIKMVEMAPPDVSGALAAGAIDAFSMGEPFPSQAEMGGFGRVLFQAREYWPDYMSCILVVRQDLIDQRPDAVQTLVDGIARSGLWLDKGKPHREDAADFVGRFYYNQKPALLRWALTKPIDRVIYSPLAPRKADFDMVRDLMIETGVLNKKIEFSEYTDTRFSDKASIQTAWKYQAGSGHCHELTAATQGETQMIRRRFIQLLTLGTGKPRRHRRPRSRRQKDRHLSRQGLHLHHLRRRPRRVMLRREKGVAWAKASYPDANVTIEFDPKEVTEDSLKSYIASMGFRPKLNQSLTPQSKSAANHGNHVNGE